MIDCKKRLDIVKTPRPYMKARDKQVVVKSENYLRNAARRTPAEESGRCLITLNDPRQGPESEWSPQA